MMNTFVAANANCMHGSSTQQDEINLIRKKVIVTRSIGAWRNPSHGSIIWMSSMFVSPTIRY